MRDDQASHTAEGAAALRAAGVFERNPRLRNPDALSARLISRHYRDLVCNPLTRRLTLAYFNHRLPGMYEAHLTRTHHFDAIVRSELKRGAEQLLVLGAGLDTRAYRFQRLLEDGLAFEVDHPATSAFKRERLAAANIDRDRVVFVDVNFKEQSTPERLTEHGFERGKKTVVTWEGVIMYLTPAAVDEVIRYVGTLAPGSSIVFDYVFPTFYRQPDAYRHARRHLDYVRDVDEPYTFGLELDEVGPYFEERGLELVSNTSAAELDARYLAGHRRSVTPWYAIAHGRVPTKT